MQAEATAGLAGFIATAKSQGVPDDALVGLLRHRGWSERRIYRALAAYYEESLGVPLPQRGGRDESPRDAFLWILNFITLGFWTIALGQLFYALIARAFPDKATRAYQYPSFTDTVATQLATIIIAFIAFVVVRAFLGQELKRRPEAALSAIRAWITYAALIIAAIFVLLDGIWFLTALLQGQLSIRFVLDSLVLLVLGGGVFAYYLAGLQQRTAEV